MFEMNNILKESETFVLSTNKQSFRITVETSINLPIDLVDFKGIHRSGV